MRCCARCSVSDRPLILRDQDCTCGAGIGAADAEHVERGCRRVSHWVAEFPKEIARSQLVRDQDAHFGFKLPAQYRGWELREYRGRMYRVKALCRDCIELESEIDARQKEYKSQCAKARGERTMTYSNLLARN